MCPSQVAVQRTVLTLGWMTSEGIGLLSHYSAKDCIHIRQQSQSLINVLTLPFHLAFLDH